MRMRDELEQKVGLRFSKGLLAADNKRSTRPCWS